MFNCVCMFVRFFCESLMIKLWRSVIRSIYFFFLLNSVKILNLVHSPEKTNDSYRGTQVIQKFRNGCRCEWHLQWYNERLSNGVINCSVFKSRAIDPTAVCLAREVLTKNVNCAQYTHTHTHSNIKSNVQLF